MSDVWKVLLVEPDPERQAHVRQLLGSAQLENVELECRAALPEAEARATGGYDTLLLGPGLDAAALPARAAAGGPPVILLAGQTAPPTPPPGVELHLPWEALNAPLLALAFDRVRESRLQAAALQQVQHALARERELREQLEEALQTVETAKQKSEVRYRTLLTT